MKALRGTFAEKTRARSSPPGSTSFFTATAISPKRARSSAETPELGGDALRRAEAALKCVAGGPQPFDAAAGRAELEALLATAPA